jgi:hypothetical protein
MDDIDGKVFAVGTAAITGQRWTFTRPEADTTTVYTGAAIALRIFALNGSPKISGGEITEKTRQLPPTSSTPALTLTLGSGLTRTTDTASTQSGLLTITDQQLEALLGSATLRAFSYLWVVTPANANPLSKPLGEGYDGVFALAAEGWTLEALAKV